MSLAPDTDWILVTGGGTGMGRRVVLDQAARGRSVLLLGRREEPLRAVAAEAEALEGSGHVAWMAADLADVADVDAVLARLAGCRVGAVVASAGGQGDFMFAEVASPQQAADAWTDALSKNLMSSVLLVEGLLPQLVDGARIVLIGSTAGLDGQGGPYATAKAALHGYGRDLSVRLAGRAITSNVIAPGYVGETEFFDELDGIGGDDMAARVAAGTPLGRIGTPGDIAGCVDWLLSGTGGWITGQTITINGGVLQVR